MRLQILTLIVAVLCVSAVASDQTKPTVESPQEARPLTAAERRGRAIYLRGRPRVRSR